MQCFESRNSDKITYMKEYNMWSDNIWRNFPIVSPTKSEWTDMPMISTINNSGQRWVDAETTSPIKCATPPKSAQTSPIKCATPPKSAQTSPEFKWKTPPKSENPSLGSLDSSPRTSTPVCNESSNGNQSDNKDQYECFKVHLHESPKKLKVRGATVRGNETMISGHIDMKNLDPFSYTFENHYMPHINKCFLNLLLNGPTSLICQEHYDPKNPYASNCNCIPVCNCRANIATNRNLPIGYKYNNEGFIVPSKPLTMQPKKQLRKPNCIYTED